MAAAITCTVIPRTTEVNSWKATISFPGHSHPLAVTYRCEGGTGCQVCGLPVPPVGEAFGCASCAYYLHLSCLPAVRTFLHPHHPLVPRYGIEERYWPCQICLTGTYLTFHCNSCNLHFCKDCISLSPKWGFEHGGHHFVSVEIGLKEESATAQLNRNPCDTCGQKGEAKYFKCLYPGCENYCHFHCIPFDVPQSIKHEYHYHPVTFVESFVEEGVKVHYCDACEEERDPEAPVYSCAECHFSAHTACAISQVLPALIAEREANPSKEAIPFCTDLVLEKLSRHIDGLLGEEKYLKRRLGKITVKLDKTERECAALMQRKEQGDEF